MKIETDNGAMEVEGSYKFTPKYFTCPKCGIRRKYPEGANKNPKTGAVWACELCYKNAMEG